jgi:enoyl-CoA hydratase/carnithine racemase
MSSEVGSATLSVSDDGTIATVLLDRAPRLNALTPALLTELDTVIDEIATSRARVTVVRTAGSRAFSVGADIAAFSALTPTDMWRHWTPVGHRVFARLGGGLELALACDFRVTAPEATLGLPETGLGLVPGWGGTERLTQLVGPARAKEIILTRRTIDAPTALAWGLVTRVSTGALEEEVDRVVADLLSSAPIAQQAAKQLIDAAAVGAPSSVLEAIACGFVATTADFAEGVDAFLGKRSPNFGGR